MGGSLGDVPRRFGEGSGCCICQAIRVTPLCIKVGLMTDSSSCKSPLRRLIWPHGSEMCWIGRQQAATSHSQGTTCWFGGMLPLLATALVAATGNIYAGLFRTIQVF